VRIIELDASHCRTPLDFANALKTAIGAPEWHGTSVNAFVDSMATGDINAIDPPYVVRIVNAAGLPVEILELINAIASAVKSRREWQRTRTGEDVDVNLELAT
jgi:hypothetical protein